MTKHVTTIGWDQAPHLTEEAKRELLLATPPYLREARSKGIPSLGSGAVYPVDPDSFLVDPFEIPAYWPRGYALDVGWNCTAALWGAHDRESDVLYLTSEYYGQKAEPAIHAQAIKARDFSSANRLNGVIDPASKGRNQHDGEQLLTIYRQHDLNLTLADNAVEAGIQRVWERLSSGRLKVFRTLTNFLTEYRMYRRDLHGKIVKEHDHGLDALRYLCASGIPLFKTPSDYLERMGHRTRASRNQTDYDPFAHAYDQPEQPTPLRPIHTASPDYNPIWSNPT